MKFSRPAKKRLRNSVAGLVLCAVLAGLTAMVGDALVSSGDAWAETACYRVQFSQNGNSYHSNSVCREDSGNIKVIDNGSDNGSGTTFNLFEIRDYYYDGPNSPATSSVCPISQLIPAGKPAVCKPADGFDLSGQILVDMLKEQCGSSTCAWGNSASNSNMALIIGGAEQVSEEQAAESQSVVPVDDPNADAGRPEATDDACRQGSALLSLGWFLCPIVNMVKGAVNGVYSSVESMLRIEPTFFTGGNNNVSEAWGTFRDLANIAFVILLLVVIFSQITGIGINNYGVKKILPKMIVAAILINLSYVICQIAIDLSNILGNGLQDMFKSMGESLASGLDGAQIKIGENGVLSVDGAIANAALPSAAIAASAAGIAAVFSNPFTLVSLLLSLVSVLISLFFLFLLLVAREAAVIILVAISPLAVVCYMLPNTKSLFDKWVKAIEGMLLLYPICGLLIGGGGYVSKLLLSTPFGNEGFIQVFAAMIVGIIPIFFIPSLLKSSFSAIGNIGAKISGIGQGLSKSATGAIKSADAYKTAQDMGQARAMRFKAGLDKNGQLTGIGRAKARFAGTRVGKTLGYNKSLARSASQAGKSTSEQEAANAFLTNKLAQEGISKAEEITDANGNQLFAAGTEGAYYGNEFLQAVEAGDAMRMNSAIQAMQNSNMQPKDIAKLVRYAESTGTITSRLGESAAEAWRGSLANQYGNGFLATDAELGNYMSKRGKVVGSNGNKVGMTMNYGDYAMAGGMGIDDLKKEDYARLSGDSLAGMAAAGILTKGMAQSIVADNPNMSEDKKIMVGAVADEKATATTIGRDAAKFKKEATELMRDHRYTASTIQGTNSTIVDKWTAPRPQQVEIARPTPPQPNP